MTRDLEGKTAFVTGSGRGLGHVIARALSSMGAALVIHDRSWNETARFGEAPNLGDALKVILESGAQAMTVTGDVSDRAAVEKMREDIEARMGQVDILVNCAGGDIGASGTKPEPNTVLGIPYADMIALNDNNLIGTMLVTQAFVPQMVRRKSGVVVNIASGAAHGGYFPGAIYATMKAAVVHYTRCLAHEVLDEGVRVNAVSPGPAKSARFSATRVVDPAKMESSGPSFNRYAEPQEVADAVCFLCSPRAKFIHGQIIRVDGGLTLYA